MARSFLPTCKLSFSRDAIRGLYLLTGIRHKIRLLPRVFKTNETGDTIAGNNLIRKRWTAKVSDVGGIKIFDFCLISLRRSTTIKFSAKAIDVINVEGAFPKIMREKKSIFRRN